MLFYSSIGAKTGLPTMMHSFLPKNGMEKHSQKQWRTYIFMLCSARAKKVGLHGNPDDFVRHRVHDLSRVSICVTVCRIFR